MNFKISAVIITLNEEVNLERCLKSIAKVVDEIIVVDSFSTDSTRTIAEQHNAIFLERQWLGYSDSKNFGNTNARSDYILSIDADEQLDDELISAIAGAKAHGLNGAYAVNRKNFLFGKWVKHSGWYPDRKIRLFPKSVTTWVGDHVHEELKLEEGLTTTELQGHLNHYTATSDEQHFSTISKYNKLGAEKLISSGKSYSLAKASIQAFALFIKSLVLRRGFLDGLLGWKIAWRSAGGKFMKYRFYSALIAEKNSTKKQ